MPNTALNRTTVAILTNKSGGSLAYGAVVILDNTNANGFTTTTTSALATRGIGVIMEPNGIANNASGTVGITGWIPQINLDGVAGIGQFIYTSTVAGQATPHASPQLPGDFGVVLSASATPAAILFGSANGPASGVAVSGSSGDIQTNNGSGNLGAFTPASGVTTFLTTPTSANLKAALTDETGSGAAVFANTPTLVSPILGTPTSGTLSACTGLPISTGVSGLGTGIATALAVNTGSAGAPVLFNAAGGTPSSVVLTNATGTAASLTAGTASAVAVGGVTGLGTGVATFLATPSSANLASALTDETGSGAAVFATSPTLVTPLLGTPTSGVLTNCDYPGKLLAIKSYKPAANTTISTTSTTLTALDTTNLAVTFTVPASGNVICKLNCYADISTNAQFYTWGLLDGSAALVSGVAIGPVRIADGGPHCGSMYISGLTPGASVTFRWAHAVTGGATGRVIIGPGVTSTTWTSSMFMPALMEVWTAP